MATLLLPATFVNLVSTGEFVSGLPRQDRDEGYVMDGEVRTMAGGSRRSFGSEGESGTYKFTMLMVPRSTIETLRAWKGLLVQVRDAKARRFFGVFFEVLPVEFYANPIVVQSCGFQPWHVTLSLNVVTAEEGV